MCARLLLAPFSAAAQVDYQPTPSPTTSAIERDWYRNLAPLPFAGDLYYPSGPTVYFNGNTMVETGDYDGVTLYADTTVEAYSVVLVPVTDGILRPYVRIKPDEQMSNARRQRAGLWVPRASGGALANEQGVPRVQPGEPAPAPNEQPFEESSANFRLETVRKPEGNVGIWIAFQGHRWQQLGEAVPLDPARLVSVGEYAGFTVYADSHEPYVIYVPTRAGLVAPFRRMQK